MRLSINNARFFYFFIFFTTSHQGAKTSDETGSAHGEGSKSSVGEAMAALPTYDLDVIAAPTRLIIIILIIGIQVVVRRLKYE